MPTKPAIPIALENSDVLRILAQFSDLVAEIVRFGTVVLKWHLDAASGGDETIPITLSLRHILELLDSVSINLKESCVDPCKILLRAALESFFTIAYITETDSNRRAMAYMVGYAHQKIRTYRSFVPATDEGRRFQKSIQGDRLASKMELSVSPDMVESAIANLESLVVKPLYKEANAEYERCKRARKGVPYWYSLYNGPTSIEMLAEHLKLSAFYHMLYRQWSATAHGTEIIQGNISRTETGKGAIRQIRLPTEAQVLTVLATSVGLEVIRAVISYSTPEKLADYRLWYSTEIREAYSRLAGDSIIHVSDIGPNGN